MEHQQIAIIGLGYVGLPLAVEFAKKYKVIGFDIQTKRIEELAQGYDRTREVSKEALQTAQNLLFTSNIGDLAKVTVYIITVPTPIDEAKQPDLRPLISASSTIGKVLKKGDIVVYESTVYPGCTEEVCVPLLEQHSGLRYNEDFFCGYSPERINPGDKQHTLPNIRKVVSGSNAAATQVIADLYAQIITAGVYIAGSIKVAEAAKVIENSQRDLNIAFINELALIFERLGIDTQEVLEAAATKWNFLPFRPGLVGGHCIGVDPYYLTHKAEMTGYHPQVILSGRRINDSMGQYVANRVVKLLIQKKLPVQDASVLILGFTFKENCPDVRNTRVIDVLRELQEFGLQVDVYDPCAEAREVEEEYGLVLLEKPKKRYEAIVLAVAHEAFKQFDLAAHKQAQAVVYDVKAFFPKEQVDGRL
jgi:UDP-N-acetyl-D-galactosamine dehydrogenase